MATSRRSRYGSQRSLISCVTNRCMEKACLWGPAPRRRVLSDLPSRRHHRGGVLITPGDNRPTASSGHRSTSHSSLGPKAVSRRDSQTKRFAPDTKEVLEENHLRRFGAVTGKDPHVIAPAPDSEETTPMYEMLVPVVAHKIGMVDFIPPESALVDLGELFLEYDFYSLAGEGRGRQIHQDRAKATDVCDFEPGSSNVIPSVGCKNEAGHEKFEQSSRVRLASDTLENGGWIEQYSGPTPRYPAELTMGVVDDEEYSRETGDNGSPGSSPQPKDIDANKPDTTRSFTGNICQSLQMDIDLSHPKGVLNCPREPVTTSSYLTIPSSTPVRSSSQSSSGRKRIKKEDDTGNDSDDDDLRRTTASRAGGDYEFPPPKFFSCPYFKSDPVKNLQCFMRFKLKRVKDVKQHLYRKHSLPEHYCPLCWETFARRSDYDDHITKQSCERRPKPEELRDAMSVDQKKAISRRTDSGFNEHEQWYNVWKILFPSEDKPPSPYLKSTELEELIPIVRWFWKKNSTGIVSNIISSPSAVNIPGTANAISGGSDLVTEFSEQNYARRLTDTMDVLLDRVEEAIQCFGQYGSPTPPSSVFAPSPLLSEASISGNTDILTTPVVPKIEINRLQEDQSASRSSDVGMPFEVPTSAADFWGSDVFGFSPTDYPEFYECSDSFMPQEIKAENTDSSSRGGSSGRCNTLEPDMDPFTHD